NWMVFIAFILSMVTLFALIAKRKDYPANLYLLAGFVSTNTVFHHAGPVRIGGHTFENIV
ncbi:jg23993, partial [Pararge aegeria aegeria]